MIDRLRLVHYKGFNEFTVHFGRRALLVGPNNAGKTTIITALRICAHLLGHAKRRRTEEARQDETRSGRWVQAYPLRLPGGSFVMENIRHEFREAETRLELRFKDGAMLYAVWPFGSEPYFYLEHLEGMQPRSIVEVRSHYTSLGIVPILTPIEHSEKVLSADHVEQNLATRLVSSHFRNQIYYSRAGSKDKYTDLLDFTLSNTPEIDGLDLRDTYDGGDHLLDLYFLEANSRTQKELYWAGDGLQIWLQILFHLWRRRDVDTLVLDEPDVFLHPDLQRRLVRLLEDNDHQQMIMATHAPEMLAEAARESVVIVDRTRRRSRRVGDERVLADLNDMLGSGFNLRLARTLRSRVALFVEGNDMRVLRNIARTVGAPRVQAEQGLAIVPMEGFSKWRSAASFSWMNDHLLDNAVKMVAILDRDYRADETVHDVKHELEQAGVEAHIWDRKELESYLIVPEAMARLAGLDLSRMLDLIDEATGTLRTAVFARYLDERHMTERSALRHRVNVIEHYTTVFDVLWSDRANRLAMVPPKDLLHLINQKLQAEGAQTLSVRALSVKLRIHEIPVEMRDLVVRIESYLTPVAG